MNKIINYAGNKYKFLNYILPKIKLAKELGCSIYVEPFLGSGVVFLNLEDEFENYYLNDLNRNLVSILQSVGNTDYEYFKNIYNQTLTKYGNLKNKKSYYSIRNAYNKHYYNTPENNIQGLVLILLINACINNLARFSKNGFNQSFGDRDYTYNGIIKDDIGKNMWNDCKYRCSNKNINYSWIDYKKLIFDNNLDNENVLMFLDPPYFDRPSYCYGQEFTKSDFNIFIDFLKNTKAKIIYTDVNHNELTNYNKQELRIINSSSPSFKGINENKNSECLYTNF